MGAAVGGAAYGSCGSAFLSLPHLPDGDIAAGGAIVERRRYRTAEQKVRRTWLWLTTSTLFRVICATVPSIRLADVGLLVSPKDPLLAKLSTTCISPLRGFSSGNLSSLLH
jgi:hypothetical protein